MSAMSQMPEAPAVRVERVEKSFPRKRPLKQVLRHPLTFRERVPALRDVNVSIARGELVGLLGPNGAGKTTLIKVLCGLVLPDRGQAQVLGIPVGTAALSRVIGLVHGEERSFYWRLTARENLDFFARLHDLRPAARRRRVADLLERVGLADDAERRFADFSSGMRQRLAIARALLSDPPVLLMDEPTRSLDPVSAAEQRDWIRFELHGRLGKTILIATHNLREAETLCDRVIVIARGRVRADAAPSELRRRGLGGATYQLRWRGPEIAALRGGTIIERLPEEQGALGVVIRLAQEDGLDHVLDEFRAAGCRIVGCTAQEPDLEAIFRTLVLAPEGADGPGETVP